MRNRYSLRVVLLAVALGACTDDAVAPQNGPRAAAAAAAAAGQGNRIRAEEAEFFQLAAELPGFGGYYYDGEGNLVAVVRDPGQSGAARARLGGRLAAFKGRSGEHRRDGEVRVRQGRFSFPELAAWRDAVSDSVLGVVPGTLSSDADEVRNRVVVGVRDERARGEVARAVARMGIPADAVVTELSDDLELSPSFDYGAEVSASRSLRSQSGPLQAGMKISYYDWRESKWMACTMGLVTVHNGAPAVLTNSHCSPTRAVVEGTRYDFPAGRSVGTEVKDPSFGNNCDWMVWQKCRSADALLFRVDGAYPADRGVVARPRYRKTSKDDAPVWSEIDPVRPTMTITGTGDSRVGATVDKVGARTGWTYGAVKETCVDVTVPGNAGHKYRCQHFAKFRIDNGDSGSPVFYWNGDQVQWLGIAWGTRWDVWELEWVSIYSPDGRVFEDMGTLPVTPPAPFSVRISGPSQPEFGTAAYFAAQVTSGVAPFTFSWTRDGAYVGGGSTYMVDDVGTFPFSLQVTVTDGTGAVRSAGYYVEPRSPFTGGCTDPRQIRCIDEPL